MRQAGTLSNETLARRFADYLYAQGIQTRIDPDGEAWAIWVRDEEQLPQALSALKEFQADPADPRFNASAQASAKRAEQAKREEQARRNFIDMRRRWDTSPSGPTPLTFGLIALSVLVAILTNLGGQFADREPGPAEGLINALLLNPREIDEPHPSQHATHAELREFEERQHQRLVERLEQEPLPRIREGQVWRLVTPIVLHFGILHLLFNMFVLRDLGRLVESRIGTWRFAALVLVVAIVSNLAQYYFPSRANPVAALGSFGGMSGVLYGLLGYAWMKSRYEPRAGIYVHPNTVTFMMIWLVVCALGLISFIANWAHGAGLVVGMAIGVTPYAWRKATQRIGRGRPPTI